MPSGSVERREEARPGRCRARSAATSLGASAARHGRPPAHVGQQRRVRRARRPPSAYASSGKPRRDSGAPLDGDSKPAATAADRLGRERDPALAGRRLPGHDDSHSATESTGRDSGPRAGNQSARGSDSPTSRAPRWPPTTRARRSTPTRVAANAEAVASRLGWDEDRRSSAAARRRAPRRRQGQRPARGAREARGARRGRAGRDPCASRRGRCGSSPACRSLVPALPYVLFHHERWDGHGYPTRRAGTAIPLEGRLLAVADAFDAMTSRRPYRPALTPERGRRARSSAAPGRSSTRRSSRRSSTRRAVATPSSRVACELRPAAGTRST